MSRLVWVLPVVLLFCVWPISCNSWRNHYSCWEIYNCESLSLRDAGYRTFTCLRFNLEAWLRYGFTTNYKYKYLTIIILPEHPCNSSQRNICKSVPTSQDVLIWFLLQLLLSKSTYWCWRVLVVRPPQTFTVRLLLLPGGSTPVGGDSQANQTNLPT